MTVADCQAVGGIVSPPPTIGEVDLRPGMKMTVILVRVARLVAAGKPGSDPELATCRDEQHRQVAARTLAGGEGFGRLQRVAGVTNNGFVGAIDLVAECREKV